MRALALCSLLLVASASAQPSSDALLSDWRSDWVSASRGVASVTVRETLDRTVDGPRGEIEIRIEGTLTYRTEGPPQRDVSRSEMGGRRILAPRRRRFETRTQRAFGRAADLLLRPAPLPGALLRRADARGRRATASNVDGRPAWQIDLSLPNSDAPARAWFSRDDVPRLLKLRIEQELPQRGRVVHEAEYRRVDGLDIPFSLNTTVTTRQRRRLRDYLVTLRSRATYRDVSIREG